MPPITFQNINTPSNAGIFRGFSVVGENLQRGLANFQNVIDERQDINQGVLDRADTEGTLAFRQLLSSARTEDEVNALAPELEQIASTLSPTAQAALLDSAPEQIETLRQRFTDRANFETNNLDREQAEGRRALNEQLFQASATNELGQIASNTAERTAEDRLRPGRVALQQTEQSNQLQDIDVGNVIANFTNARNADDRAEAQNLGQLAVENNLPVTSTGLPDLARMTASQRAQLNIARASQDPVGTHDPDNIPDFAGNLTEGDTRFSRDLIDVVTNQFGAAAAERNLPRILQSADSTLTGGPVGNDARQAAIRGAQTEIALEERERTNRFTPGSPDARNAYRELSDEVAQLFKDEGFGAVNDIEDLPDIQKLLGTLSREGLELRDGSVITPSRDDVIDAIRSTRGGFFTDARRAKRIREHLETNLASNFTLEQQIQAEQDKILRRQLNVLQRIQQ